MSSFCIFVKPTGRRPATTFVNLTQLGPVWRGDSLRLRDPERFGLRYAKLVGWSDFYAGSQAPLAVARATDGDRSGWVIWGGTLGVRAVPDDMEETQALAHGYCDERPLIWVDDVEVFPIDVAGVVSQAMASS